MMVVILFFLWNFRELKIGSVLLFSVFTNLQTYLKWEYDINTMCLYVYYITLKLYFSSIKHDYIFINKLIVLILVFFCVIPFVLCFIKEDDWIRHVKCPYKEG